MAKYVYDPDELMKMPEEEAVIKNQAPTTVTSADKRAQDVATLSNPGGSVNYTTYNGTQGTLTNTGQSWNANTDYSQLAYDSAAEQYAKNGYIDLDYIDDILDRRQDKMDATGSNGGGMSNLELWQDILSKYNGSLGPDKASTTGTGFTSSNQTITQPQGNTTSTNKQTTNKQTTTAQQSTARPTVSYGDFSYTEAPDYYDAYQTTIDAALDKLLNRDAFSYNAADDPVYQQYADTYTREGERAMEDTMARAAARTGGLASTYAVSAAQQANQYYMQQLADKVPELYQMAYQMYLDDINLQVQDLGLLQNASETAYNRYRDTMSDWYADRDFAYGSYRDDIADQQWQTQFDYNAERDSIADQRYDTEWEYQLSRDELADQRYDTEWAYQQAQDQRAAAQQAASGTGVSYADEITAVAAYLGLSEKEANALKNIGSSVYTDALAELGIGGKSSTPDSPNDSGGDPELDMDSVLALGYGPISETRLAELVKSGAVEMYVEGGKTKFRKKAASNGYNSMYNLAL